MYQAARCNTTHGSYQITVACVLYLCISAAPLGKSIVLQKDFKATSSPDSVIGALSQESREFVALREAEPSKLEKISSTDSMAPEEKWLIERRMIRRKLGIGSTQEKAQHAQVHHNPSGLSRFKKIGVRVSSNINGPSSSSGAPNGTKNSFPSASPGLKAANGSSGGGMNQQGGKSGNVK